MPLTFALLAILPNYDKPPSPYPLRLVGSSNSSNVGRLEILINSQWVTICCNRYYFGWKSPLDAQVACRQLGFLSMGAVGYGTPGYTSSSLVLDGVSCHQLRPYITDCANNGFFPGDCAYSGYLWVRCQVPPINYTHPVRLYLNGSYGIDEGTVEILNRTTGEWGSVCDDYFGFEEATVVCLMLGFRAAIRSYSRAHFGPSPAKIVLDDVRCSGNENELFNCQHLPWGSHDCSHYEDVGVACTNATIAEFPVRLVDGSTPNEGRVEIQYNGVWGTVCDDYWDINDARVVCQQLGYPGATRISHFREYPAGTGTIWMDDVHCIGNESLLASCPFSGWADHNCRHMDDAGVVCSGVEVPTAPVTPAPVTPAPVTPAPMAPAPVTIDGPVVGGTIVAIVVLLVIIVVAVVIVWRGYLWRKHSELARVSVHVGDGKVNLFGAKAS